MSKQKFHKGDVVLVDNYYPWIQGMGVLIHKFGHGEQATVVGSYKDQYPYWGGEREKHIYTLKFKNRGRVSWYDEAKLTLVKKK